MAKSFGATLNSLIALRPKDWTNRANREQTRHIAFINHQHNSPEVKRVYGRTDDVREIIPNRWERGHLEATRGLLPRPGSKKLGVPSEVVANVLNALSDLERPAD